MTKLTKIDRDALTRMRPEIDAALRQVAEAYGVTIACGKGTYSNAIDGSFKLEIKIADEAAQEADNAKRFAMVCRLYDLEPRHLGTLVTVRGKAMTLVGIETSRQKYPLKMRHADGKTMLYTESLIPLIKAAAAGKAAA